MKLNETFDLPGLKRNTRIKTSASFSIWADGKANSPPLAASMSSWTVYSSGDNFFINRKKAYSANRAPVKEMAIVNAEQIFRDDLMLRSAVVASSSTTAVYYRSMQIRLIAVIFNDILKNETGASLI
jgi:hypothetical protein